MFSRARPQQARHSDGYVIQIGGPHCVQYLERNLVAEIEADLRSLVVPLHVGTLRLSEHGHPVDVSAACKESILRRIEAGLGCLGVRYELVSDAS